MTTCREHQPHLNPRSCQAWVYQQKAGDMSLRVWPFTQHALWWNTGSAAALAGTEPRIHEGFDVLGTKLGQAFCKRPHRNFQPECTREPVVYRGLSWFHEVRVKDHR